MMPSPCFSKRLGRRLACLPVAGWLALSSAGANAQESVADAPTTRTLHIEPRVSVSETMTNNVRLSNTGQQSEQITEISPGIRISSNGGRFKTYLDYALTQAVYAQNTSPSRSQNALTTFGTLEAVDNRVFLDFNGSISQQSISAFGAPSVSATSLNGNQTEVSNYQVSPYVRGRLGNLVNYEARYSRAITQADTATTGDQTTADGSFRLSGDSAFRNLGWSADISRQQVDFSAGRATESDRLNLSLSYLIDPQLSVFASGGQEANNFSTLDKQSAGTSSYGVSWSPSTHTKIAASQGHRSFGDTYNVSVDHQTARTAWRFSDTKDASVTPAQVGIANLSSILDLATKQLGSSQTAAQVLQNLLNLQNNPAVSIQVLNSAVALVHRQDLSVALLGLRDTLTFSLIRSEISRLDTTATGFLGDFATSSLIRQDGVSINYAHRLTPDYSLNVVLAQQNTSGDLSQQESTLHQFNINVAGRVGKKTFVSLGLRRSLYSSNVSPYDETAIHFNLIFQL